MSSAKYLATDRGAQWLVRTIGLKVGDESNHSLVLSTGDAETLREYGLEIRSYSGRGMYGHRCLGIVHDDGWEWNLRDTIEQIASDAQDCEDEAVLALIDYLRKVKPWQDQIGLRIISYWPNIEFTED